MKALGQHFILELSQCNPDVLSSLPKVREYILEAARQANAQVLKTSFHKFSPQGVSGVVVIAESHLSIHTWPEEGYAAADIYTCGETTDPERACDYLASVFGAKQVKLTVVQRGVRGRSGAFSHLVSSSPPMNLPTHLIPAEPRSHAALKSA